MKILKLLTLVISMFVLSLTVSCDKEKSNGKSDTNISAMQNAKENVWSPIIDKTIEKMKALIAVYNDVLDGKNTETQKALEIQKELMKLIQQSSELNLSEDEASKAEKEFSEKKADIKEQITAIETKYKANANPIKSNKEISRFWDEVFSGLADIE